MSATAIDLSPILTPLVQIAGTILMGVAAWASIKIADHFHVAKESILRTTILDAIDRGIAFAQTKVTAAAAGAQINSGNPTVVAAANYVISKFPDTLKTLGISAQNVSDMVIAKLPAA